MTTWNWRAEKRNLRVWSGARPYLLLLSFLLLAPGSRAQEAPPAAVTESPASPTPPPSAETHTDPALARTAELRQRALFAEHRAIGKRLFEGHKPGEAAQHFAVAYSIAPGPEILLELGAACRRAELDFESLMIYERLQKEPQLTAAQSREVEEELKGLRAKLEDSELDRTEAVRAHMSAAKDSFRGGRFLPSAQEYAVAYAVKPLPRLLFNIAQSYRRAGRPDEAYILYTRLLEEESDTPLKKETLGYLKELRGLAFRPPLYRRPWFWAVLGTAAAVVAGGVAGTVYGVSRQPVYAFDGPVSKFTFSISLPH